MSDWVSLLPHVNASLNALATVLLVTGLLLIQSGREVAHKRTMLSCFAVSVVFLICYLTYHYLAGHRTFSRSAPTWVRYSYFTILVSHVVLAALVPFLAVATIYTGLRNRRDTHRRLAHWTFPIWLYVSVTGVVVYVMLYQIYSPTGVQQH